MKRGARGAVWLTKMLVEQTRQTKNTLASAVETTTANFGTVNTRVTIAENLLTDHETRITTIEGP